MSIIPAYGLLVTHMWSIISTLETFNLILNYFLLWITF